MFAQPEGEPVAICMSNGFFAVASMLFSRGGRGKGEKGLAGTTPHASCWRAERGDVAEAPMEILTQTLMSGKELVCISPP